jgi:hypothetical protein
LFKSLTERVLNARQKAAGLELEEDDHTLTLKRKDEIFARWNILPNHPTPTEIQEAADRVLESDEGLFDFTVAG